MTQASFLSESLLERVLFRLSILHRPDATLENLRAIYAAWCRRVPFDNVRKLIHVRAGSPSPLPGSTAEDFFEGWLRHGTGGTCWAGAGALHALLSSLGFSAERGVNTMLVAPNLPPNHGNVRVGVDGVNYLVDSSILYGEPLRLDEHDETRVAHPAWGVRCVKRDGRWHVMWRPLNRIEGFECRVERFGASRRDYQDFYEQTRGWGPFNYEVTARLNQSDRVIGIAFGKIVSLESDGSVRQYRSTHEQRTRMLIEEVGLSEEIVGQLPKDLPTPPPPWSRTAQMDAAASR